MKLNASSITQQEAFMLIEMRINRKIPSNDEELQEYFSFAEAVNKAVIESTRKKPKNAE